MNAYMNAFYNLITPTPKIPLKNNNLIIDGNEEDIRENDNSFTRLTKYDAYYLQEIANIRSILPWFIITFGLIGNLFILIVFLKKSRRTTSSGFCFCALAISDIIALIFMLLRSLLKLQVVGNVALACKFIKFIYYSSLQISSWFLVLLTVDRLIAVLFVFKYGAWSKRRHIVKLLILIIFTILFMNSHLLLFVSSQVRTQDETIYPKKLMTTTTWSKRVPRYSCYCNENDYPIYYKYFYSKWDVYHSIIYGFFPFLIILASNVAIILKLTVLKKQEYHQNSNQKENKYIRIVVVVFFVVQIKTNNNHAIEYCIYIFDFNKSCLLVHGCFL